MPGEVRPILEALLQQSALQDLPICVLRFINFFIRTVILSIINLILIFISSDVQVVQLGVAKTRDLHAIVSV